MRRVHGVRMRDFWRGKVTPRELITLIKFLPVADSVFWRAVDPDAAEAAQWGTTDYLIAALFDLTAQAHFKNPKPLQRPHEAIEQRREKERLISMLEAQAERNRQRELAEGVA